MSAKSFGDAGVMIKGVHLYACFASCVRRLHEYRNMYGGMSKINVHAS